MNSPLQGPNLAKSWIDVFPPGQVVVEGDLDLDRYDVHFKPWATFAFALELMRAGVPRGQVMLFMQLLRRSEYRLDYSPAIREIAADIGVQRQNVSVMIKSLKGIGVIEDARADGRWIPWRFPVYEELMARIRAWKSDKSSQDGKLPEG